MPSPIANQTAYNEFIKHYIDRYGYVSSTTGQTTGGGTVGLRQTSSTTRTFTATTPSSRYNIHVRSADESRSAPSGSSGIATSKTCYVTRTAGARSACQAAAWRRQSEPRRRRSLPPTTRRRQPARCHRSSRNTGRRASKSTTRSGSITGRSTSASWRATTNSLVRAWQRTRRSL